MARGPVQHAISLLDNQAWQAAVTEARAQLWAAAVEAETDAECAAAARDIQALDRICATLERIAASETRRPIEVV